MVNRWLIVYQEYDGPIIAQQDSIIYSMGWNFVNNDNLTPVPGDIIRSSGQNFGAVLAQADSTAHASGLLGVWVDAPGPGMTGSIKATETVEVNCTESVAAGDLLYLSAVRAGKATKTAPTITVCLGPASSVRVIDGIYKATIFWDAVGGVTPGGATAAEALANAGITANDAGKLKRICDLFLMGAEDTTSVLTTEEKASALAQFDAQRVSFPNQEAPPANKITGFIWKDRQGVPHLDCMSGAESGSTNFVRVTHNGNPNVWIRSTRFGYGANGQFIFDWLKVPGNDLEPSFVDGVPPNMSAAKVEIFSDTSPAEPGYAPTLNLVSRGGRDFGISDISNVNVPLLELGPEGRYRSNGGRMQNAAAINGLGFISRWTVAGDASARTITLPLVSGAEGSGFECLVDWGDGTPRSIITAYNSASRVHTYAADGTYDVEIRGKCEGWSFNNSGDKLKCVGVVCWGGADAFLGFKYITNGFKGCSNFTLSGLGKIVPSTVGTDSLAVTGIFEDTALSSLPNGFIDNLQNLTGFAYSLRNVPLLTLPYGLLSMTNKLTNISYGFMGLLISTFPDAFLDTNPDIVGMEFAFSSLHNLTGLKRGFLRNQRRIGGRYAFHDCPKLQLTADIFYDEGEQSTRFVASGGVNDFYGMFNLEYITFTGTQGVAPDLWNCDYGETITLDVAPSTDWALGDTITGQTSGATAVIVEKVSTFVYHIKKHFGTFTSGEIIGVTGVAAKLADQGAAHPTFVNTPISEACFRGHSLVTVSNFADIPACWK